MVEGRVGVRLRVGRDCDCGCGSVLLLLVRGLGGGELGYEGLFEGGLEWKG